MNIGILTFHSVFNFGANLQLFSTISYLKENGFNPMVINWLSGDSEFRYKRTTPILQGNMHKDFLKNYIPYTKLCRTDEDIVNVIDQNHIESVIIGSDAVLQHRPFLSRIYITRRGIIFEKSPEKDTVYPNPFWGSFIPFLRKDIPVFIMSASSQNTPYKYIWGKTKKEISDSLKRFKYISVRDQWTRNMIVDITNGNIDPPITPDPVFAYNQNIINQSSRDDIYERFNLPPKYLLFSFRSYKAISREWLESFQSLAEKVNYQCIALTIPSGISFEHPFIKNIDIPLSPTDWYSLIKYSSGYIGENMHPIVIALHNQVPFFAFDSYGIIRMKYIVIGRSSKIYDLLSISGFLDNRINILGRGYRSPSPDLVLEKIVEFDKNKCKIFADSQLTKYNKMMELITSF